MATELQAFGHVIAHGECVPAAGHAGIDHGAVSDLHGTGVGLHHTAVDIGIGQASHVAGTYHQLPGTILHVCEQEIDLSREDHCVYAGGVQPDGGQIGVDIGRDDPGGLDAAANISDGR